MSERSLAEQKVSGALPPAKNERTVTKLKGDGGDWMRRFAVTTPHVRVSSEWEPKREAKSSMSPTAITLRKDNVADCRQCSSSARLDGNVMPGHYSLSTMKAAFQQPAADCVKWLDSAAQRLAPPSACTKAMISEILYIRVSQRPFHTFGTSLGDSQRQTLAQAAIHSCTIMRSAQRSRTETKQQVGHAQRHTIDEGSSQRIVQRPPAVENIAAACTWSMQRCLRPVSVRLPPLFSHRRPSTCNSFK